MKKFYPVIISILILMIIASFVWLLKTKGYRLVYQVTPSMTKGFYFIKPVKIIKRSDIVLFKPPKKTLSFLLRHHWLPHDGLMLKYVFAVPGDYVCQKENAIWINHKKIAPVYRYYAAKKSLPNNHFCGKLKANQYLLMSTKAKRSFDGRYFGPINRNRIIGGS
jgi:conjugative transfer signal peptidase TraF